MPDLYDDLPSRAELARDLLLYKMWEYAKWSCASWRVDQEFHLYEAAVLGRFPKAVDEIGAQTEFCKTLGDLGALANGWWAWPSTVGQDGADPVFVPMAEWTDRVAKRQRRAGSPSFPGFLPVSPVIPQRSTVMIH